MIAFRAQPKILALCGIVLISAWGCSHSTPSKNSPTNSVSNQPNDHSHNHSDHGSHEGHVIHLEPDGYHAEWLQDEDKRLVTVYLDELKTPASEVKFVVRAGDSEPQIYLLQAQDGSEGGGTWTITSDALLTHLAMGDAAKIELIVIHGNKEMSSKIELTAEHDHKH